MHSSNATFKQGTSSNLESDYVCLLYTSDAADE